MDEILDDSGGGGDPADDAPTREDLAAMAAKEFDAWIGGRKKKSKVEELVERRTPEMLVFRRSGDWEAALPSHFLALHCWEHERVYGIRHSVSESMLFAFAPRLRDRFDGDPGELASFMRWAWLREEDRVRWMRQNGITRGRVSLSLRLLFSEEMITEYLVRRARGEVE